MTKTEYHCPKCRSQLYQIDVLVTEDDTECGLSCPKCDYTMTGPVLGEFLFEDYNEDMYD